MKRIAVIVVLCLCCVLLLSSCSHFIDLIMNGGDETEAPVAVHTAPAKPTEPAATGAPEIDPDATDPDVNDTHASGLNATATPTPAEPTDPHGLNAPTIKLPATAIPQRPRRTDAPPTATLELVTLSPATPDSTAAEPGTPIPYLPPANAVDFDELPKSQAGVTYADINKGVVSYKDPVSVLVVFVGFTDGYKINRTEFEKLFTGSYPQNECIRSVSSYFKYNSYGKVDINFTFYYYETGMTSRQAWHLVNDEDETGDFYGNQFFFDIFDYIKAEGKINFKKLDSNTDGCVDVSLFVFGEKTELTGPDNDSGYWIYGSASGTTFDSMYKPDVTSPVLKRYIKTAYEMVTEPPEEGMTSGLRTIIHELSHAFGVSDYYDFYSYEGKILSTLGGFDMMDHQYGDWNPFSKFACGWLEPYVVNNIGERLTIRIGCSSDHNAAILIPSSNGWNGTPFDEYILIDVMAPVGANGFDWAEANSPYQGEGHPNGGVRVYHVDARLERLDRYNNEHVRINPYEAKVYKNSDRYSITPIFYNTNGLDPHFEGDSRFYHLIDIVPADGTSKYRITTPVFGHTVYWEFTTGDLFVEGDTFSMESCADAFVNGTKLNCGATVKYSVTVDFYDEIRHEAYVTILKLKG